MHGTAEAQARDTSRTKRDTIRSPRDTIPRRDSTAARRDTTRDVRVPVPAREDSLLRSDSLLRRDSLRAASPSRDTLKAPIATAEAPTIADPNGSFVWDRNDMFSTGALTVLELLDRIPGVTGLRSGWIAQPMIAPFLGDPGRVRVFLDGLELLELDPRMNGVWDLSQIPLWALDDIRIERGASELRIFMRSWRVDRTTPFTRTDVYTGDQSTNLYRGLFGRRYRHGEVTQLAGQQFGTDPGRNTAGSDQLGAMGRIGVAQKRWSADAFLLRLDRNRALTLNQNPIDTIPSTESTRTEAYVRFGWGSPDSGEGPWIQGIANASRYTYGGDETFPTTAINADTSRFESQYLLAGGYSSGRWRASFAQRYRAGLQRRIATPIGRLGMETRLLTVSALAEGRGADSTRRFEVAAVVRPVSFFYLAGAAGLEQPQPLPDSLAIPGFPTEPRFMRAEAGLRIRDLWLSGGVLRRDPVVLDGAPVFFSGTVNVSAPDLEGVFATVRGRIWKALYADAQGMQWSDPGGFYRPKHQTRSELYVSTSLPKRFPNENFHLLFSAVHEYRSSSFWPDSTGPIRQPGFRSISTLLQFRIIDAEIFWSVRNIRGEIYTQIPGYRMPRLTNTYGVRWKFWN